MFGLGGVSDLRTVPFHLQGPSQTRRATPGTFRPPPSTAKGVAVPGRHSGWTGPHLRRWWRSTEQGSCLGSLDPDTTYLYNPGHRSTIPTTSPGTGVECRSTHVLYHDDPPPTRLSLPCATSVPLAPPVCVLRHRLCSSLLPEGPDVIRSVGGRG